MPKATIVHYLLVPQRGPWPPESPITGCGMYACCRSSRDPGVVTCRACKRTKAWRKVVR